LYTSLRSCSQHSQLSKVVFVFKEPRLNSTRHPQAFALHANKRYKFSCKSVLLLHPIESFAIFLSKFVLLGTKIT
jgi:hypothetical protein